jgi:hypothetical protein
MDGHSFSQQELDLARAFEQEYIATKDIGELRRLFFVAAHDFSTNRDEVTFYPEDRPVKASVEEPEDTEFAQLLDEDMNLPFHNIEAVFGNPTLQWMIGSIASLAGGAVLAQGSLEEMYSGSGTENMDLGIGIITLGILVVWNAIRLSHFKAKDDEARDYFRDTEEHVKYLNEKLRKRRLEDE